MPFFVQMNPNTINREKVQKLKDVGLQLMSFGMQSASERIRKIYGRPETLSQIKMANQILHELRISHFFDVIVDNPYETHDDLEATLRFLLSLKKPFLAKTFDLVHLPNTELTEMLLKDNKISSQQIEGSFEYKGAIDWRVRESDVTLSVADKYMVALIQMTGNVILPNVILKTLFALRKCFPKVFKMIFSKIVLTNWYFKNQGRVNAAVSLVRDRGMGALFGKLVRKLGGKFRIFRTYAGII